MVQLVLTMHSSPEIDGGGEHYFKSILERKTMPIARESSHLSDQNMLKRLKLTRLLRDQGSIHDVLRPTAMVNFARTMRGKKSSGSKLC